MTDKSLVRPSPSYDVNRENQRNRRIEELFRLQEIAFNQKIAALQAQIAALDARITALEP